MPADGNHLCGLSTLASRARIHFTRRAPTLLARADEVIE
jgi:hypothetical protein